jgi:hypothetical protein
MDIFVADVQGFQRAGSNIFIPKQIAVKKYLGREFYTCILEPPYPWQEVPREERGTHRYVESNLLRCQWRDGTETLDEAKATIRDMTKNCKQVYVKGVLKELWFAKLIHPSKCVVNVEAFLAPSLLTMSLDYPGCKVPSKARTNVNLIEKWLIDNQR